MIQEHYFNKSDEVGSTERLENKNEKEKQMEKLPHAEAILVLGCELRTAKDGSVVTGLESKMRTKAAAELLKAGLVEKIIVTGGVLKENVSKYGDTSSIADAMRTYLVERLEIPSEKIIVEGTSLNTTENLEYALSLIEKEHIESVLLETNEYHLGRAKQLFQNILQRKGYRLDFQSLSAEDVLNSVDERYRRITSHYQFPESVKKHPSRAVKIGLRELLRRVLIFVDRDDKLATFLAQKIRGSE
jgi:uncharacterized SAM-binding protein YcdF (DUF218 family)